MGDYYASPYPHYQVTHEKEIRMTRSYHIDEIGGNCPVQAEGHIGGKTVFYFRARGHAWSMSIGPSHKDLVRNPEWYYTEYFGEWPDAGWMEVQEAKAFIDKAINLFWNNHPSMA